MIIPNSFYCCLYKDYFTTNMNLEYKTLNINFKDTKLLFDKHTLIVQKLTIPLMNIIITKPLRM